jgi:ABC-type proline/glycine betaine transport system permease subunit
MPATPTGSAADAGTNGNGQRSRRSLFGPPPTMSTADAVKQVAEDASALVKAEIALAKAEIMEGVRSKAMGAGMFAAAGVLAAIAGLGLLLMLGFLLAEVGGLPGWASALIVSATLLLIAAVLVLVGKRKLAAEVSVETTKRNVEEDVAWTKQHLTGR